MGSALTQDFIQDGKTFMIIDREQGFASGELSRTQTGMMLSSRIQGVLQLHLHELNMKSQLRYDITGKRMLKHCLQSEAIGIAEYLGLLLQLISTLEESSQYMLSLSNYILDEDYMFIDGTLQAGRLYIAYVPVTESLTDEPVQEHIAQLASQWIAAVRELHGNIVQQILRYCQDQSFTLAGLKQLLLHQLVGGTMATERQNPTFEASYPPRPGDRDWAAATYEGAMSAGGQPTDYNNTGQGFSSASSQGLPGYATNEAQYAHPAGVREVQHEQAAYGQRARADWQTQAAFKPTQGIGGMSSAGSMASVQQESKPKRALFNTKKKQALVNSNPDYQDTGDMEQEPKKLPSSYRTYLLAGSALLIAMIWRYGYLEHGNDLMLYGCSALTITVVLTIYLILKGKISIGPKSNSAIESVDVHSADASTAAPLKSGRFGSKAKQEAEAYGQEQWRWNKESIAASPMNHPAAAMPNSGSDVSHFTSNSAPSQESVQQRERSIAELFGSFAHSSSRNKHDNAGGIEHNGYGNRNDQASAMKTEAGSAAMNFDSINSQSASTTRASDEYGNSHGNFSREAHQFENQAAGYANHAPTETLSSHMATVLLDERDTLNPTSMSENVWNGYLERRDKEGGSNESIRLRKGSFIIGRAEDGVHYHEKSVGTSRNHVELEVRQGQVFIKDLGSRNGTQLKGEALVPYKSYPMQDGDSFTIARALYTLRLTS